MVIKIYQEGDKKGTILDELITVYKEKKNKFHYERISRIDILVLNLFEFR